MNGNNTEMLFEVLSIVTVIYLYNIVCGLNEVIIKKLCNCTLLSYDNIILQLFNGEMFVIYIIK